MADTDIERLVIELQASNVALSKSLATIARDVDRRLLGIEKRTDVMSRRVTSSFNSAGRAFSRLGATILGGAAFVGISRFVSRVVDAAGKIQDTADALGISTDALQAWGIMAGRAGVNQEAFSGALDKFAKKLGEAQIKGGEFAKLLNNIGVGTKGSVEEVFLRLADAVQATGSQEQKVAITTAALGKSAANLVPILQQGSAAIRSQTEALVRNGSVMTRENIAKLDELGDKWEDLKRRLQATAGNVLGGFADEFSKFADQLSSPEFQTSLKEFGAIMAQVAAVLIKAAPFLPNIAGAIAGAKVGRLAGGPGALIGAGIGAVAPEFFQGRSLEALQKDLANAEMRALREVGMAADGARQQVIALKAEIGSILAARAASLPFAPAGSTPPPKGGGIDRSGALATVDPAVAKAAAEATRIADAEMRLYVESIEKLDRAFRAAQEAGEEFRQTQGEIAQEERNRSGVNAQGLSTADLDAIDAWHEEAEKSKARAIEDRLKDEQDALDKAAEKVKDLATFQRDVLGDSLVDIGLAARQGFGALEEAATSALNRIIDMVIELQVIRPLLEALGLGETKGGVGGLGRVGKFFGFAGGGIMGPHGPVPLKRYAGGGIASHPQLAMFGEGSGNEAFVPLPDGRRIPVTLKMPNIPPGSARQSMNVVVRNEVSLTGANGDETIKRFADEGARKGASFAINAIKRAFPDMMVAAEKRKL